jgi:hypothetical protein
MANETVTIAVMNSNATSQFICCFSGVFAFFCLVWVQEASFVWGGISGFLFGVSENRKIS